MAIQTPAGWANDTLSEFQDIAIQNEIASYAHLPHLTKLCVCIDGLYTEYMDYIIDTPPPNPPSTGMMLFVNAHSQFRASARLALAGHLLPMFATTRACLESAVYGWFLETQPGMTEAWIERPKLGDQNYHDWMRTFKFGNMLRQLAKVDEKFKKVLETLHQVSIDFGAHPNIDALRSNMSISPDAAGFSPITMTHIHAGGELEKYSFDFMLNTSVATLELLNIALPSISNSLNLEAKIYQIIHSEMFKAHTYS